MTPITYDKSVEENERLREKLNDLREQNASVASQNHYLKNKAETMNLELMQLKTKVCIFKCICFQNRTKARGTMTSDFFFQLQYLEFVLIHTFYTIF